MSFMFSPVHGVNVKVWSLQAELVASAMYRDRLAYFIFYQRGLDGPAWEFHIDLEASQFKMLLSFQKSKANVFFPFFTDQE